MIKSFKHKGLKQPFEKWTLSGMSPKDSLRINDRLRAIDSANFIDDLNIFTFNLHQLKGDRVNIWSITVRANWRITFEFINGDTYILSLEDCH